MTFGVAAGSQSTYAVPFKVPEGFPDIVAELTTEILRVQPEDAIGIYRFAAEFFSKKVEARNQRIDVPNPPPPPATEALEAAFKKFDTSGDGHIDVSELKDGILELGYDLTDDQVGTLMKIFDISGNKTLELWEFRKIAAYLPTA